MEKDRIWDFCLFGAMLCFYSIVTFHLFHNQACGSEVWFDSDMRPYVLEIQGLDSGYSFPYQLYFKLGAVLNLFLQTPQMAAAVALVILNSLSVVFAKYYANQVLLPEASKRPLVTRMGITLLVFALFFVAMLHFPDGRYIPGIYSRYRGVFSPNPYHNATYMAARPFSIVVFFLFARLLKVYEEKFVWKDSVLFGIFLFLATVAKPSFTFVFVPAAGLIMLYRLIRGKFSKFGNAVKLGLCFVPTFCALLYQFFGVFGPTPEGESGIGFGIARAWSYHCDNIPLAMVLGLAFPLAVLVLNWKELKRNGYYRLSWQLMAVSLVEVLVLYEKGFRESHMNFCWGYMCGMFFVFFSSVLLLFEKSREALRICKTEPEKKKVILNGVLVTGQWILFLAHLICGVCYFLRMYGGGTFY